ncbi:MAG: hypothetical protein E6K16_07505 [Methanobacteriota archaeon]|nr:MAG: hypothetical protein E6K16_07505 [Euryarchaeota archaeon]
MRLLDAKVQSAELTARFAILDARKREDFPRHLERLRRDRDRASRVLEQRSFYQALEYTRLDVTLDSVMALSRLVAAVVGAVFLIVLLVGLGVCLPPIELPPVSVFVAIAPIAAYVLVASYPEWRARRMRVASLGGAPEAVNYMAMAMRVVPALDRAVEFAAHHSEEPLASRLRQLLWSVYLRSPPGIEAAFLQFAGEWGEWQEDLKRAFFAIGSASSEQTEAGLDRTLDKARMIAFEGTKARIMEYAAGLRGPTTVLFAVGVLLPVIIGAMLPMISLGGLSPGILGSGRATSASDLTVPIVLMMDALFPAGAFAYAYHILGNRPGTASAVGPRQTLRRRHALVAVLLIIFAIPAFVFLRGPIAAFVPLWLSVGAGVVYIAPGLRDLERRRRENAKLEAQFPDALFLLGSRIAEGAPAERALQMTADATRGSEVATLFGRIVRALQISREGLEEVLFAKDGVLRDVPSRTIRAALRMIVEVSRKDPASAGKTIVETSTYLRDLRDVDREISRDLSSVVPRWSSE